RSHMNKINENAPVSCRKAILIEASPQKIWNVITDIDNWTSWQTKISKSKINGSLTPNTTFKWKSGGVTIHSRLHTVEPFKYFGWTGNVLGVFAIHNWT